MSNYALTNDLLCHDYPCLMVSALDFGASGLGSSPGRGHCVMFLGKTLCSWALLSQCLSPRWTSTPSRRCRNTTSRFMLQKLGHLARMLVQPWNRMDTLCCPSRCPLIPTWLILSFYNFFYQLLFII